MKKIIIAFTAFALMMNVAQSQDGKIKKKAAVTEAKATVAVDKADLKANKAARDADKVSGDKEALKADRKAHVKKEGKLMKDQAKKDVKVAKEKI
jgi:hypothetical protein